jgi:histone deacetylase 1/2
LFDLWHKRLGHAGIKRLKLIVDDKLIKTACCDLCMKGKIIRKSFNSHFNKAKSPLEVIHADLVGPILPSSNEGALYFLTRVDQFSGYIEYVTILKKSDAVKAIKKFKTFFENQRHGTLLLPSKMEDPVLSSSIWNG